jgi:hypothetical protein
MSDGPGEGSHDADDPRRIRSIAVTTADVVAALEANVRRDVGAVLRVTPPFNPRARARLHRAGGEGDYEGSDGRPLHVDPASLVADTPPYPSADDTEDELRRRDEYTAERHRKQHVAAVEDWRDAVAESVVADLTLSTPDGDHVVEVKALG